MWVVKKSKKKKKCKWEEEEEWEERTGIKLLLQNIGERA
jgi:hypothetical protein